MPEIAIKIIHPQARIPQYMSNLAAGADLAAALDNPLVIAPGAVTTVSCGFCMEIPPGYEAQIRPRSGLAIKSLVTVPNSPGTIDADYRGEVKVPLYNFGTTPFTVTNGMRIAQMVIAPVVKATFTIRETLSATERGNRGFGSTNV